MRSALGLNGKSMKELDGVKQLIFNDLLDTGMDAELSIFEQVDYFTLHFFDFLTTIL